MNARRRRADPSARAAHGFLQPVVRERLHQVVDRVGLEGLQRVLVEGGHEDDGAGVRRADMLEHAEAVQARHLDVEEHELRA